MAKEVKIIVASATAGAAICACVAQMINRRTTTTAHNKKQLAPQTRIKPVVIGSCNAPGCYNNHQDS